MLYRGDATLVLPTLKDIGLVLVDPPFVMTGAKWDVGLDWDAVWTGLEKACKSNTYVLVFGLDPFLSPLRCAHGSFTYKYDLIWDKMVPSPANAKKYPMRQHENIAVFYNGACMADAYRPQKRRRLIPIKGYATKASDSGAAHPTDTTVRKYGEKNPISILRCNKVKSSTTKPWLSLHPTQKPVPLLLYLIRTYSNDGDTVLDFTMGSGSTGIASRMAKRRFVGIEKDKAMFNTALSRIRLWEREVDHAQKVYDNHFTQPA
jgi:DNA modification methylase